MTLVLTDRRTGAQRRITTFTDGAFYALGIKPGDYELAVDESVLALLGLAAPPVRFTVSPADAAGEGDRIDAVVLRLTSRP